MTARKCSAKGPVSKEQFLARLSLAWARTIAENDGKRATFAENIGVHPDTVKGALSGEHLPEAHTIFNSIFACPNALAEVLSIYGKRLIDDDRTLSPDMATLIEASRFVAKLAEALSDDRRDHRETLSLADLIRPLMPKLSAIVVEADAIRSGDNVRVMAR